MVEPAGVAPLESEQSATFATGLQASPPPQAGVLEPPPLQPRTESKQAAPLEVSTPWLVHPSAEPETHAYAPAPVPPAQATPKGSYSQAIVLVQLKAQVAVA
jgi:hypothetical protein